MKNQSMQLLAGMALAFLIGMAGGQEIGSPSFDEQKEKDKLIQLKSDSIRTLKESLQTSNEKRGRLFLALLYTDIPGKEKELDSLLLEIGKDN